jgi:Ca-activated chloride channel family protein
MDKRLRGLLDLDLRIVMSWDADLTDIDNWVIEPTGEKADYTNQLTAIGGSVSRDFTQGYGPEEYTLRSLVPGTYRIQANYYGSQQRKLIGSVTLRVVVFTNYGRADEERRELTVRLPDVKSVVDVGSVELAPEE